MDAQRRNRYKVGRPEFYWDQYTTDSSHSVIHSFLRILFSFPVGAMFGWILVEPLLRVVGWGPREPRTVILCCGVVAVAMTICKEYLRYSRKQEIRLLARQMSLHYSAKGSQTIVDRLKSLTGRDGIFTLENVMQGGRGGIQILIGDFVSVWDEEDETTRQTVVYFTAPDLYFPQFALQPERRLLNLLGELAGLPDIDFPSYPKFSSSYHLSSLEVAVTQQLFDAELLSFFSDHPGWEIRAEREFMMLAQGDDVPVREWQSLLDESQQILSLFRSALEQLMKSSPVVERKSDPIRSHSPTAAATRAPAERSRTVAVTRLNMGDIPQRSR